MEMLLKYMLYILIISSSIDYAFFKPIPNDEMQLAAKYQGEQKLANAVNAVKLSALRMQRQVVQPKWLTEKDDSKFVFVDKKVTVNEGNLKEAAATRAAIQDAIDTGKYFVDGAFDSAEAVPTRPTPTNLTPAKAKTNIEAPTAPWTKWWSLLMPDNEQKGSGGDGELAEHMQRTWEEFLKLFKWF